MMFYLRSNVFGTKESGAPREREVCNIVSDEWEEPNAGEKELLMGYTHGGTAACVVAEVGKKNVEQTPA